RRAGAGGDLVCHQPDAWRRGDAARSRRLGLPAATGLREGWNAELRELGRQGAAHLIAPTVLRAVQRRVGHRKHSLIVEHFAGLRRPDAEAHRDRDAAGGPDRGDMRAQGLRDRGRALEFGAGQEDQELLASDPVGEIECPQLLAELLRDLLEHEVADLASPRLVDLAEVIEVSDDDAYRIAG